MDGVGPMCPSCLSQEGDTLVEVDTGHRTFVCDECGYHWTTE